MQQGNKRLPENTRNGRGTKRERERERENKYRTDKTNDDAEMEKSGYEEEKKR